LLREAYRVLPEIAELELTEAIAGLRPGTPDNVPLIGPGSLDGLVVATGHYRNGILLVPVTADAVAAVLAGEDPPEVVAPMTPRRFEGVAAG
jgi:glycine oxidase